MTNIQRTCVTGLFIVLMLVHSTEANLSDPTFCYILDAVLLFYCIVVTGLFFHVKLTRLGTNPEVKESDHIYQDLHREGGSNAQPELGRKTGHKKRQSRVDAYSSDMDAYETLAPSGSAPQRNRRGLSAV